MAVGNEIRTQIRSIKNTQKITGAMEMVAASKRRKAQERMHHARPYALKIRAVIRHLADSHPEYHHPFLQQRPIRKVGLVIVTSDRGLCGGLNMNVLRTALNTIKNWREANAEIALCLIGNKAGNFFKRYGGNILAHASHLGDTPSIADLVGAIKIMLDSYEQEKLDALFLIHNEFVNSMIQKPALVPLLPIQSAEVMENPEEKKTHARWDYIYEPDAKTLLDLLLKRYIESQIYRGVIENIACEQAARMVAMKNASENAGDLINTLQLAYNKARQAAITQELAEIVAGAAAV